MPSGMIVQSGRVFLARHLLGLEPQGITHCALGEGDASFTDPANPPSPNPNQTALKSEHCRKKFYKRSFLEPFAGGEIAVDGQNYRETETETNTVGVFFIFDTTEANDITIREYGFLGGDVQYITGLTADYAEGGLWNPTSNPGGQVLAPGRLFEVKHISDFYKYPDTQIELIGIFHV